MTAHPSYWSYEYATLAVEGGVATVQLNNPALRNAMGAGMFESLHTALRQVAVMCAQPGAVGVVLLCGAGPTFCGGFDLEACSKTPALLRLLVERLSAAVQELRALPVPVVAQVQGAAIAGGCALLAACDFVVVAPDAQLGYPVHRIGVSPAVNLPALTASAGAGSARAITMGGALYRGADAVRVGLATHVAESAEELPARVRALCESLRTKGPHALRVTKAWLNELDGTASGAHFAHAAEASAAAAEGDEFARMLREFWASRK